MKEATEGVIKFRLDHHEDPAPDAALTAPLRAWFMVLRRLGLLGQDPARYLGYAYGNLSRRHSEGFVITCTQTSGREALTADHFALVTGWELGANQVRSLGPCRPSSEALTHAVIYETVPGANFVFHVHSPEIWSQAKALAIPVTDPTAEYGTPQMALATVEVLNGMGCPAQGLLSMGGHEDGIVSWGTTAEEAGGLLVNTLARALSME